MQKNQVSLKRVMALAAIGIAIALVVVQVVNMLRHDVLVKLLLSDELIQNLSRVEMVAVRIGQSHPDSIVEISFDQAHPADSPIEHRFELTNGTYELHIRVFGLDKSSFVRTSRLLEVSGPVLMSYQLP